MSILRKILKEDAFKAGEFAFLLPGVYPINGPRDYQDLAFCALSIGCADVHVPCGMMRFTTYYLAMFIVFRMIQ